MSDSGSTQNDSLILFLEKPESSKRLASQFEQFDYKAFITKSIREIMACLEDSSPAAMITDSGLTKGDSRMMREVSELRKRYPIPLFSFPIQFQFWRFQHEIKGYTGRWRLFLYKSS